MIGQVRVAPDANEITAAVERLETLPLAAVISERGVDYLFTVKDNQPALQADIALAFGPDSPLRGMVAAPYGKAARTRDKAHGRIEVSSTQAAHLVPTWPGEAQVCRLTRHRRLHGKQSTEIVFAITGLLAAWRKAALLLLRRRSLAPAEAFDHFAAYQHKAIKAARQKRTG